MPGVPEHFDAGGGHPGALRSEVRRRRQCYACGERFTTYERIDVGHEDPLEHAVVEFVRGLDPTLEEATS
jgi:hypothetical protein